MAEAIARYDAADVIEPSSAGLVPLGQVADLTKDTLLKNGYSFNELSSGPLTPEAMRRADIIINMTGNPHEEIFGEFQKVEDWIVEDPFGSDANTYQRVFEGIRRRVHLLADSLREARQMQKAE